MWNESFFQHVFYLQRSKKKREVCGNANSLNSALFSPMLLKKITKAYKLVENSRLSQQTPENRLVLAALPTIVYAVNKVH